MNPQTEAQAEVGQNARSDMNMSELETSCKQLTINDDDSAMSNDLGPSDFIHCIFPPLFDDDDDVADVTALSSHPAHNAHQRDADQRDGRSGNHMDVEIDQHGTARMAPTASRPRSRMRDPVYRNQSGERILCFFCIGCSTKFVVTKEQFIMHLVEGHNGVLACARRFVNIMMSQKRYRHLFK